jgi:hypothetical protein
MLKAFRQADNEGIPEQPGLAHLDTTTRPAVDSLSPRRRSGERVRERGVPRRERGHFSDGGCITMRPPERAHLRFFGARNSFRQIVDNGPLLRNKFRAPMCPCEWPSKNLRCALVFRFPSFDFARGMTDKSGWGEPLPRFAAL